MSIFYYGHYDEYDEAFRETGTLLFYPEGRTYSPPARRAGGGIPPSGRAARSSRGMRLLREPTANAAGTAVPVIIVCAKEALRRSLRLRKPATGSFVAEAGRLKNDRPAFSLPQRETERLKVKTIGHLPFGSKGRQPRGRPLRLRGLGLYELLCHLQRL